MHSSQRKYARYQLLIALGTLVLTPIFSGLVVQYQITQGQAFWENRQAFLRSEAYLDRKLKLVEDITQRLLQIEVSAKEIQLDQAYTTSQIAMKLQNDEAPSDDFGKLQEKMVTYHRDIADLVTLFQMTTLYFGPDVVAQIEELRDALQENYNSAPNFYEELTQFFSTGQGEDPSIFAARLFSQTTGEPIPELTTARLKITRLMFEDISRSHSIYRSQE